MKKLITTSLFVLAAFLSHSQRIFFVSDRASVIEDGVEHTYLYQRTDVEIDLDYQKIYIFANNKTRVLNILRIEEDKEFTIFITDYFTIGYDMVDSRNLFINGTGDTSLIVKYNIWKAWVEE